MHFFRVTLELLEPVLVNRSVSFDGILAHMNYRRSGDAETAHLSLPLAGIGGIYQASELLFLGPAIPSEVQYVVNPRWDRFERGELADGHGKRIGKITARGARKPTLDRYDAVSARRAFALARGDAGAVEDLIGDLDAVGKKSRSRGFGRLKNIRIDLLDNAPDTLGYTDYHGQPVRVVPVAIWTGLKLSSENVSFGPARPRLPRWATDDELCALPASHLIQPHEHHRVGL